MRLPSASAVQRGMACPSSFLMPQVEDAPDERRARGTTFHAFMKRVNGDGVPREEALAEVPIEDPGREACEAVDLTAIPAAGRHEVALSWDPETDKVKLLGYDINRQYEAYGADRTREICVSIDLAGSMLDSRAFIFDYKTGRPQYSCRESWQMRTGAVIWSKHIGADEALTGHLVVNGSDVRWDLWEIDQLALSQYEGALRGMVRRMRRMKYADAYSAADVTEGKHCKYCPAYARCPAKNALVTQMVGALQQSPSDRWAALTLSPAKVWRELDRYDAMAKRIRQEIEKLVLERGPIDLGDEYELRVAEGEEKDVLDQKLAITILVQEVGQAALVAGRVSKKSISAVVQDVLGKEAVPRVLGRMRDMGALKKIVGKAEVREVRK